MDRSTYWLLDTVVTKPVPVSWLALEKEELELALNRSYHGLTHEELVQKLFYLCQRGDLAVFQGYEFDEFQDMPMKPSSHEIEGALAREFYLHYVVTPQGGRHWEEVSKPDWSRYIFMGGSEMMFINAGDRGIAEEYLELYPHITGDITIVPDSVEWEVMQPWRATYWKTIPAGYRVRFRTISKKLEPSPDWVQERWSALSKWYTSYLEK